MDLTQRLAAMDARLALYCPTRAELVYDTLASVLRVLGVVLLVVLGITIIVVTAVQAPGVLIGTGLLVAVVCALATVMSGDGC